MEEAGESSRESYGGRTRWHRLVPKFTPCPSAGFQQQLLGTGAGAAAASLNLPHLPNLPQQQTPRNTNPSGATKKQQVRHFCSSVSTFRLQHHRGEGACQWTCARFGFALPPLFPPILYSFISSNKASAFNVFFTAFVTEY